jgi:hypothetical protein
MFYAKPLRKLLLELFRDLGGAHSAGPKNSQNGTCVLARDNRPVEKPVRLAANRFFSAL